MSQQQRAEQLLSWSVNGFAGARELLEGQVEQWLGEITMTPNLQAIHRMSMNSPNLRVRAAGIEVYLAAHSYGKSDEEARRLIEEIYETDEHRPSRLFVLGLLSSRGVAVEVAFETLTAFIQSGTYAERYWAVEGLAYSGDLRQIPVLLEVFGRDPSPKIRERAACSLAQSGMLQWADRWQSISGLLEMTQDETLDDETLGWVHQALRDITGERTLTRSEAWIAWWETEGRHAAPDPHDDSPERQRR